MTTLQIEQLNANIGAIIHDIDLSQLHADSLTQIQQALLDYQVIFFRGQQLSAIAQAELARAFGSLHIHPIFPTVADVPEIIVLDSWQQDLRDNELWHTDVTFSQRPPLGCVLQAIKIPEHGGDTLWSSATAAFAALDQDLQQKLRGLTATHDIRKSFPLERFAQNEVEREKLVQTFKRNPPVHHPVVRSHPVTGEEILFISEGFTTQIDGLDPAESDELLTFLFAHSTAPRFHIRWQWHNGDVAIWDNRCTQHKALFDYGDAHRIMHRATINGDIPYYEIAS
ncbi:taurine dioxygenase [Acinetobacter larvae]|uniref:Taurine dioxygenase n=2 Tax=Acinetobacter larvae TaxID=1789224 RepID=A0A1B2M3V2_9GAMM|nr:taurine dioxygenase [Acinetobacter larvae]AOA59887.1 taurine dioxygenase [Acinetobacter larvae]